MTNFYQVEQDYKKLAKEQEPERFCYNCVHACYERMPFETALLKAERIVDAYFEPREGFNRKEVLQHLSVELGRASASCFCTFIDDFLPDPNEAVGDCEEYEPIEGRR